MNPREADSHTSCWGLIGWQDMESRECLVTFYECIREDKCHFHLFFAINTKLTHSCWSCICVTDHWHLWNQNSPVEMTALMAKLPLTVLISYIEISQHKQWQSIDHMVLPAFPNLIWSRELVPVCSDFCWAASQGRDMKWFNNCWTVNLSSLSPPPSPFSPPLSLPLSEWGQTGWLIRVIVAV